MKHTKILTVLLSVSWATLHAAETPAEPRPDHSSAMVLELPGETATSLDAIPLGNTPADLGRQAADLPGGAGRVAGCRFRTVATR